MLAMYLRGKYEYLINESQAQGRYSEGAVAPQDQAAHVHMRTICPPVKHRPKMSLTLQIPENLICSHANAPQRGCCQGHFAVPRTGGRSGTCGRRRARKGSAKTDKDFTLVSSSGWKLLVA